MTLEAFALNSPLFAVKAAPQRATSPESGLLHDAAGSVELALGSIKKAEDGEGLILRLYEPHGARGESVLRFDSEVKRAERTNLLEEAESSVPTLFTEGDTLRVKVRPFEVLTLRLEL